MNKGGIYYPNGEVSKADQKIMLDLGLSNITFLHDQRYIAKSWRERYSDGIINCRFYLPNWRAQGPKAWAQECARIYLLQENGVSLKSLGVHVTPANEMNLAGEGGGWSKQDYIDINYWLCLWYDEFVAHTGIASDKTHFPAWAYGHSDDQDDYGYIGDEICRPAIEKYGNYNSHPYFSAGLVREKWHGHRFQITHERYPDKPIFCDESGYISEDYDITNPNAPNEIADHILSLYDFEYVTGVCYFIFRDPTGRHKRNDWGRNKKIEQRIKGLVLPEVNMEFQLGFKTFAGVLASRGINPGKPKEPETAITGPDDYMIMRQRTITGKFLWDKEYNDMLFWSNAHKIFAFNGGRILETK